MDIFVSSTYEDLKEERAAAIEAVDRVEHAVRMEEFSSSSMLSRDECLLRLQDCDAIVLLIGDRYGSIDPRTGYSVTELEYRTAIELNLPVLVFLKIGETGKWHSTEQDPETRAKHEAFKQLVHSERTRTTFQSPDDLKFEVVAALNLHAKRFGRIGMRGSVFQTLSQFFQKYLDSTRVFNHAFPLVGRQTYIQQLRDVPTMPQRVFILQGAGGMGKSKILQAGLAELERSHPETTVCLLAEGTEFTSEHVQELPGGQIVIVVDDAHRLTTGLRDLLAMIQPYSGRIKLILSTRLHGLPRLRQDLAFAGFDQHEIVEFPEVRPLSSADVETLATEILGAEAGSRLGQLVSVSRDSPLITVIAGQLFVCHRLDPSLLSTDDTGTFRLHVLSRFQDELLGNVAAELDPDRARKVLRVVAALTPLDPERTPLMEHVAEFLKIEMDDLLSAFDILERSRVLVRQARMLRISPDVLSDHILYEACFTEHGQPKTYGRLIFEAFRSYDLRAVLQNMAELDWRVGKGAGTGLLQEAWRDLEASYQAGGNQERLSLLGLVAPVAYFQPSETLVLVRLALQIGASVGIGSSEDSYPSAKDILHITARILRDIAYHGEHTREAASLLWQLGRDDNRLLDKTPEHPIHLLQELAAYARSKPLGYNRLLLDWLEELAQTDDAFQHLHSPLDILPALLQREGTEHWSRGRSLIISSFLVDPKTTAPVRRRVLTLMHDLGKRSDPARRRTVVKGLVNVIFRGIIGLGNFRPTEEHFAVWQDEDRVILSIVVDLLRIEDNPVLVAEVEDDLLTIFADPRHTVISDDVAQVIAKMPLTLEVTLIRYLRQGSTQRRLLTRHKQEDTQIDLDAMNAALEQELNQVLTDFYAAYNTPAEIKHELENLFGYLSDANVQAVESYFLLRRLCQRAPDAMLAVCELLVTDPESQALPCLPILFTELREHDVERVLSGYRAAEASSSLALRRTVAWALGIPRPSAPKDEQAIIRQFALDDDHRTALAGIRALSRFPSDDYADVMETLDQITISHDAELANCICQLLDPQWGIDPSRLPKIFICRMLDKLVSLEDWSHMSAVQDFVVWVTAADPECAASYYLARIAYQHELPATQRTRYSAVPHILNTAAAPAPADARNEAARARALRTVRDSTLQEEQTSDLWRLTDVFARLSEQYSAPALSVLEEWIDSGDPQKLITAAHLLQNAGSEFVFANETYAVHLLEVAQGLGADVFEQVQGTLYATTQLGFSAGWVGAPDPKDEILRDRSIEASRCYPEGHVANSFYKLLHDAAMHSINRNLQMRDLLDEEYEE